MEPAVLESTLKKTAFQNCKTNEEFIAGVIVANTYQLNPILKEMYIFPAKGGGVMPIVSIDGWISLVNRQPTYDGHTFEVQEDPDSKGGLASVTCKIYVKGRQHPCVVTEFMAECYQDNKEPWKKWPRRMLQHKAFIQCARYAFGFSGLYDPDEGDRIQQAQAAEEDRPLVSLKSDKADQPALPPASQAPGEPIDTTAEVQEANPEDEPEEAPWPEQTELAQRIEAAIQETTDPETLPMVKARFERHFKAGSKDLTKKQRSDLNALMKKHHAELAKKAGK